jgi:NAD(P)-dependent dehydrogenase (short-subunit alcohol dehydrogenase family)
MGETPSKAICSGNFVVITKDFSMVNNAGVAPEADKAIPIHLTTEDRFDFTMKINARSPFLGCKYAAIQMLKQDPIPGRDRGWMVNISSVLAVTGLTGSPCYAASKGAVLSMTRVVAVDLAPYHIHCNAILPGCES